MAYKRINPSIHTHNGISYESQYDSTNGNTQLIQVNAPTGTQPIFSNGSFTASANSAGLSDAAARQTLYNNIQSSVRNAHTQSGGIAKGAVLQPWAQLANQGKAPSQSSSTPANAPDPNNSSGNSSGNPITAIAEAAVAIGEPIPTIKSISVNGGKFGVGNESRLFSGMMKYPEDMEIKTQDHMIIEQFGYLPPSAASLFSGAKAIWSGGLVRGSDFNKEKRVGQVFLPMPNSVQDSNSVGWEQDGMNNMAAGATADVMGDLKGYLGAAGLGVVGGQALGGNAAGGANLAVQGKFIASLLTSKAIIDNPSLKALLSGEFSSMILNMGGKGVDVETILARGGGVVPNNNMEFLFKSPTLRTFNNFSWRMTARSLEEASMIRRIIRFFKQGMAPKKFTGKSGEPSYMLGTPNIFRLSYNNGNEGLIEGVNLFKTCALTNFATNYTPDGFWAAYDKGQPLSVSISMSFNELEPIYDTDYQQDNIFSNSSGSRSKQDLTGVTDQMVGY